MKSHVNVGMSNINYNNIIKYIVKYYYNYYCYYDFMIIAIIIMYKDFFSNKTVKEL